MSPEELFTGMEDVKAWSAVREDLRRVLNEVSGAGERTLGAPVLLRMAKVRLRAALVEQADEVKQALGDLDSSPETIRNALEVTLGGGSAEIPVLEALSPGVRGEALAEVADAIARDVTHLPALRTGTTLAQVAGRWEEAILWLGHLAEVCGDHRAETLIALADIEWSKLGRPHDAGKRYRAARAVLGEDPALLDKMLKLHLELQEWEQAIGVCNTLLTQGGRPEMMVTYQLTLGEIHVFGLEEPGAALAGVTENQGFKKT